MAAPLAYLAARFAGHPVLAAYAETAAAEHPPARRIATYRAALPLVEELLWRTPPDDEAVTHYQHAYRELEALLARHDSAPRHRFLIAIPVADRPHHLQGCLDSLLALCHAYHYGGCIDGHFPKVTVVVADDSQDAVNVERHLELATHFSREGLETLYFGRDEQLALLARLPEGLRARLTPILGDTPAECFFHKGASITRNLTYLRLNELIRDGESTLCYFIDSDQEFRVEVERDGVEQPLYAINYLYQLDHIFSTSDTVLLTGKVVGDPPVSPAVMAGNLLDDLLALLEQLQRLDPGAPCGFHADRQRADDAAYHDMADLFGFKAANQPFLYRCDLQGVHDHRACLGRLAERLDRFFDGEHPTRRGLFGYAGTFTKTQPARTVYTGNYIFRPEGLAWFIPFATLKLRMAGPALGRLLKASLGERFVSANLPMLHRRTVEALGQSEYRAGIDRSHATLDLSDEFERQFYGDVMLFALQRLGALGFPGSTVDSDTIEQAVSATETELHALYTKKHRQLLAHSGRLRTMIEANGNWWHGTPVEAQLHGFLQTIEHNFGSEASAYKLIAPGAHRQARHTAIIEAIAGYRDQQALWQTALSEAGTHP